MASKPLTFQEKVDGVKKHVALAGNMDENANYAPIKLDGFQELRFDFSGVELINSAGIQRWILFFKTVPGSTMVYFDKCPVRIVNQLNLFPGFTAEKKVRVVSFFAPYYCEETDENFDILLERDKYFKDGQTPEAPPLKGGKTGNAPLEFDAIEAKYFQFLKRL